MAYRENESFLPYAALSTELHGPGHEPCYVGFWGWLPPLWERLDEGKVGRSQGTRAIRERACPNMETLEVQTNHTVVAEQPEWRLSFVWRELGHLTRSYLRPTKGRVTDRVWVPLFYWAIRWLRVYLAISPTTARVLEIYGNVLKFQSLVGTY